jgi:hypothetical protein
MRRGVLVSTVIIGALLAPTVSLLYYVFGIRQWWLEVLLVVGGVAYLALGVAILVSGHRAVKKIARESSGLRSDLPRLD